MYIHQMPYTERHELCQLLDYRNNYKELGEKYMGYDRKTIDWLSKELYLGKSPTEELLTLWSQQNHKVKELFILLSRMKHYQAMTVIKHLVDEKYHCLIKESDENVSDIIRDLKIDGVKKQNNNSEAKILNVVQESCEDNNEVVVGLLPVPTPKPSAPKSPLPLVRLVGNTTTSNFFHVAESSIRQIPYDDLRKSTNNWDPRTVLGKGGFGIVFKGTWICTEVAIKRIEPKKNTPNPYEEQMKQSFTELHCLNSYRHDNILPLFAYSIDGPQPCLIYQYMRGGSLENRLHTRGTTKLLNWPTRLNIAIGTARGLQFLHTIDDKPLIHGDIKPGNILLDTNDIPRIGDFGLAREGPHSNYTHIKVSQIHGTRVYLPDEFLRANKFSTKVDTYSFGIVLFEIATALCVYSVKREANHLKDYILNYKNDLINLKDERYDGGDDYYRGLMEIGKMCVNQRPKDRPEMVEVLTKLEAVIGSK